MTDISKVNSKMLFGLNRHKTAYRIKTRFPLQSTVLIDDLLKDIIAVFYCKQTKQTTAQRGPEDRLTQMEYLETSGW